MARLAHPAPASVVGLLHELRQVELLAELADQPLLRLQVVDVLFLVAEDVLEDARAGDSAMRLTVPGSPARLLSRTALVY